MSISPTTSRKIVLFMLAVVVSAPLWADSQAGAVSFSPFSMLGLPAKAALWPLQSALPMLASRGAGGRLSGDSKYRYVFQYPSGEVINNDLGLSADLQADLDYPKENEVFESVSRVKLGRLSLRTYYYTPIRGLSSELSRLDWPQWRFGTDLDLMRTSVFRFGANADYTPSKPKFSLNGTTVGTVSFEAPSPLTAGAHFELGAAGYTGFALNMEARWRTSVKKSLDFSEVEVCLGLITRTSHLGVLGVRGGYRHTKTEFEHEPYVVHVNTNAAFVELVCFY
jgi:hypothetical protein